MKQITTLIIAAGLFASGLHSQSQGNYSPVNPLSGSFSTQWITFVGATDTDELMCVRDMPDGGVVVCGRTLSTNFPGMDTLDSLAGSYDMVIFRMDSAGQLLWTTLYGGQYFESASSLVVVDSAIYVAGYTDGNDVPMINAYQSTTGGSYDAVILRLGFDGTILQSSYFGGTGAEMAYGIDADSAGNIVIGGSSTSGAIPMSAGNFQPNGAGAVDAFIAVLDSSFAPIWSTFYGGSSTEDVHQLTVTPRQKIVMIGGSFSLNFPCTANAFQPGRLGNADAYYVVFDMQGNREYATYYGGSSNEDCFGVAGDAAGNVYIAGHTSSIDFNTAGTIFQPMYAGVNDAWIARFDSMGTPVFSTFFGGTVDDKTWNMDLRDGYLYVSGVSSSPDLPMNTNIPQDSMWGGSDGFIVKFDSAGNYVTSSFLGGTFADDMFGITVNSDTMVTCVGATYSSNFPVTAGAYQMNYVASGDGFVARFKLSEVWSSNVVFESAAVDENSILLFPNPNAGNQLVVRSGNPIEQINIYASDGSVVKSIDGNSARVMQIGIDMAAGVYFVAVSDTSGKTTTQKMIIVE